MRNDTAVFINEGGEDRQKSGKIQSRFFSQGKRNALKYNGVSVFESAFSQGNTTLQNGIRVFTAIRFAP